MNDLEPSCTCWRLPTEDGRVLPMTFVCLHDEVRVTLRDGTAAQGFSTGADWWGTPEGPQVYMEIEPPGADCLIVEEGQVATAHPVDGYTDRRSFDKALARLITSAANGEHGDSVAIIVSDHATVEVTVTRHEWGCSPPARPRWRTEHEPSPA